MPKPLATRLASLPLGAARAARRFGSPLATALSARALGAEKRRDLAEMIERADRIVAVCGWLRDALVANGAPEKKLIVSRQGVTRGFLDNARANPRRPRSGRLELLYLGRWHWTKGVDVVVRAISAAPRSLDLRLTMRGPEGAAEERAYKAHIRALVGDDPRFCFADAAPNSRLPEIMAQHDCLVVPSLWLETGPMVALEAQACGLFVLGSRLGGLAELLDGRVGGELVEAGSVEAWRCAILRLAERAAANVPRETNEPRTMAAAAADMIALYDELAG
jgi:glycosyltransferase involved in cell wall biosynthesis